MKKLPWLLICGLLASCAMTSEPDSFEINGLIFSNSGEADIQSVRLTVQETHRFIACHNIVAKGGICATEFPAREYIDEKLTIAWSTTVGDFLVQDQAITHRPVSGSTNAVSVFVDLSNSGVLSISLVGR